MAAETRRHGDCAGGRRPIAGDMDRVTAENASPENCQACVSGRHSIHVRAKRGPPAISVSPCLRSVFIRFLRNLRCLEGHGPGKQRRLFSTLI